MVFCYWCEGVQKVKSGCCYQWNSTTHDVIGIVALNYNCPVEVPFDEPPFLSQILRAAIPMTRKIAIMR